MNTALRATIAIVVLSGAVVLSSGVAAAAQSPVRTDSSSDIDAWVEQRMAARGLPGTAVAVVRGGEVVHLAGYGVADDTGRTVTPDTPFILGSASKPFTGVVIGQLVEEGLLSWDEPVWPHLSHLVDEPPDGFETATVEQLLTHTAGLGMIVGTAGTVTIHEGPDALDRRVDELLSRRLAAAPGEGFNYSNAGFMLLAAVTEQVTGRPFADELGDRVFDPLGMTGSFATADDPRAADMATGHQQWFGRWRPVELAYDDAGTAMGYIASTASDLATFMQAHLDGHPAIPASAADIITGTVVPTGWDTPLDAGYGHGWFIDERAGTPVASHPGSLGHFTAHILLAPDADGLGIAVVSNASAVRHRPGTARPAPRPTAAAVHPVSADGARRAGPRLARRGGTAGRTGPRPRATARSRSARTATAWCAWMGARAPARCGAHRQRGWSADCCAARLGPPLLPGRGWAVTAGAWIALTWGLVRVVTAVASSARARRLQPPAATPGVRKSEAIWEP